MQAQNSCVELNFQLGTNVTDCGGSVSSSSAKDTGYTDLGLPSGTIWKNFNATGFYTSDEAVSQFGNRLPTKKQWEELKAECQWSWNGSGYKVTGPNGNSIVLPQRQFHRVARLGHPLLRRKCQIRGVLRLLLVVHARRLRRCVVPLLRFRRSVHELRQPLQRQPLLRSRRPSCPRLTIARARAQSHDIHNTLSFHH